MRQHPHHHHQVLALPPALLTASTDLACSQCLDNREQLRWLPNLKMIALELCREQAVWRKRTPRRPQSRPICRQHASVVGADSSYAVGPGLYVWAWK